MSFFHWQAKLYFYSLTLSLQRHWFSEMMVMMWAALKYILKTVCGLQFCYLSQLTLTCIAKSFQKVEKQFSLAIFYLKPISLCTGVGEIIVFKKVKQKKRIDEIEIVWNESQDVQGDKLAFYILVHRIWAQPACELWSVFSSCSYTLI